MQQIVDGLERLTREQYLDFARFRRYPAEPRHAAPTPATGFALSPRSHVRNARVGVDGADPRRRRRQARRRRPARARCAGCSNGWSGARPRAAPVDEARAGCASAMRMGDGAASRPIEDLLVDAFYAGLAESARRAAAPRRRASASGRWRARSRGGRPRTATTSRICGTSRAHRRCDSARGPDPARRHARSPGSSSMRSAGGGRTRQPGARGSRSTSTCRPSRGSPCSRSLTGIRRNARFLAAARPGYTGALAASSTSAPIRSARSDPRCPGHAATTTRPEIQHGHTQKIRHRHRRRHRHRQGRRARPAAPRLRRRARRPSARSRSSRSSRDAGGCRPSARWPCPPTSPIPESVQALFAAVEGSLRPARPAVQQRRRRRARRCRSKT